MFRRRTPLSIFSQIRSVVWPERGFRRLFSYLFQRVVRLPGTSASIAIGVASGVAVSFTPFVGLHFLIAALLAILMRGNVLASAIGTFFGNPWTFLLIWVSDYRLGLWLMSVTGYADQIHVLNFNELVNVMTTVMHFFTFSDHASWQDVMLSLEQVFLPMAIGGTVLAILAWLLSFLVTYYVLEVWRAHRVKRLAKAFQNAKTRKTSGR
jgi:uncharacterized protein (DUF2062 family)